MRNIFVCLCAALLLIGCQKVRFEISGEDAEGLFPDGTPVLLTIENGNEPIELNTEIKDGVFFFSSKIESPAPALLTVAGDESELIIVEKGKIKVSIRETLDGVEFEKSGTKQNDKLQEVSRIVDNFVEQLNEGVADEDVLAEEFINNLYLFVDDNADQLAGQVTLLQYGSLFELDQLTALVEKAPEDTKEKGGILYDLSQQIGIMQTVAVGKSYVDFAALTPEDEELKLSELIGQKDYTLLDFWASWCGPCRRSMPSLKELLANNSDKLQIVGLSLDKDKDAWLQAVQELGITWQQVNDPVGTVADMYGVSAIPTTFLIGKDGLILGRSLSETEIEEIIK